MCKMYVVNKLYLGNRELGYELWNENQVVEMTSNQIKNSLKVGKDIKGLVIDEHGELVLDKEGFLTNNMMIHRHIGNYEPMLETDSNVNNFYIVMEKQADGRYSLISSRFERVTVTEDKLVTYLELGLISGGAMLQNGKVVLPEEKKEPVQSEKKEQETKESVQVENKEPVVKKESEQSENKEQSKSEVKVEKKPAVTKK